MTGGYAGTLLFADLTGGTLEERPLTEDMARRFIGGYGLGARVLYSLMNPGVAPLAPESVIGFVTGPLTGTAGFFSGRYAVVCKSPVTGGWNDASSGGFWGPELKKAGYDAVFVSGAAPKPVYIWIHDGRAEIRDAAGLWGKDIVEAEQALIKETGEKRLHAAMIGPAGERLSPIAAVMNDGHRAAGRGGPGAVMGSKKLKAIAVRGTGQVPVARPELFSEVQQWISSVIKDPKNQAAINFSTHGTANGTASAALSGDSPVKNWGGVGLVDFGQDAAQSVDGVGLDAKYQTKKYACANCPLGCGAEYEQNEGELAVGRTDRPEYETAATFGVLMLNRDAEALIKCNEICNRQGLDTISAGATIAWAIECYENGLITRADTGGIELCWGNAKATVAAMEAMADQTGFGEILLLGSQGAARRLGKGFEYLQTVRGIELPMHDPKFAPGLARTYRFDPTPARHVKGGLGLGQMGSSDPGKYNYQGTGENDLLHTTMAEVSNSTGLCLFGELVGADDASTKLLRAVTGWDFTDEDRMKTGMRIMNMRHAFNLREGLQPADWVLPPRCVGEPAQAEGPLAGITIDHRQLGKNFFAGMQWDEVTGKPSRQSLQEQGGMDDVIKNLYGR
jgi:aldehyde:ferredoxin oxidoreductase